MQWRRSLPYVALLATMILPCMSQAQDAATDAEIEAAIQTVKKIADPEASVAGGFKFQFTQARNILVRNPQKSLGKVSALLAENVVQLRLNGAIILAQIAENGHKGAELVKALQQCMGDQNEAVVYWGLQGLTTPGFPEEARREAIATCLEETRTQLVRMTAVSLAHQRGVKSSLPWLLQHIQSLLPKYNAARDDQLAIRQTRTEQVEAAGEGRDAAGVPVPPRGRPQPPRGGLRPAEPGMEGAAPGSTRGRTGTVDRVVVVGHIDPDKQWLDPNVLEQKIREFGEVPVIWEFHTTGLAIEDLARKDRGDYPFTKALSFEYNPPWKLKPCAEAAVAWMSKHKAEFSAWPKPKAKPAPPPEPEKKEDAPKDKRKGAPVEKKG